MRAVGRAVERWASAIATASAVVGRKVSIDPRSVFDRAADLPLGPPGRWSPNRSCRLVRAADGWIAINLPREDDLAMVPAWLGQEFRGDPWCAIVRVARTRICADLLGQARLLGLAMSIVGETGAGSGVLTHRLGAGRRQTTDRPRVVDLTSMWAGPLCASLLAEAGADVVRYESVRRPDPTRIATPAFYARLNDRKAQAALDFAHAGDRARLTDAVASADMVVTSARPRAFEGLGITPASMMVHNPALIWVAITGHGWLGDGADRVAFGDDAAAAGGLLDWTSHDEPRFAGDALADPLTGLAAAAAALEALQASGGVLIDAALSRVAADAASD